MMTFMIEGGFNMWLMVASTLAIAGLGFTRAPEKRAGVFQAGVAVLLIEAILGLATGMSAVAAFTRSPRFAALPDQAAIVGQGLGELANNGLLGAALATLVGIAALALRRPAPRAA